MTAWLKKYWPALIASAFLIAILDGMISSAITCHPVGANADHGTNAQENQQCTALAGPILLSLSAIVAFLDKHGEAVVGAFTIVLATFTGRLWYSTEKLWTATSRTAEISERALTELEAPFLAININDPGISLSDKAINFGTLQCSIINYGRTPASILEFFANTPLVNMDDLKFATPIDPQKTRGNLMPYGVIAPPNGGETRNFPFIVIFREDFREVPPPPPSKTIPFFIGFLRYKDVLNNCFVLGFCFMYERESSQWLLAGGDEYNYCRKERSPTR